MGPELSELELSDSDSDSSAASILGVCLHGFDGDAWMSDAEGAQDDMQVGAAAGGEIPWRTTAWSAGGKDVGSGKAAKSVGEGHKQPASALNGKSVMFDLQGVAIDETADGEGDTEGGVQLGRGSEDDEAAADPRGKA